MPNGLLRCTRKDDVHKINNLVFASAAAIQAELIVPLPLKIQRIATMKSLILKAREDKRIRQGGLWIYSNEVDTKLSPFTNFTAGDLCLIHSSQNEPLAIGYINPHNLLCCKILTRSTSTIIDEHFFITKLSKALSLRERFFTKPFYRLVFSEGDFLPGLIIDRFGDYYCIQLTTAGMENLKAVILAAMITVLKPKGIFLKNNLSIREQEKLSLIDEVAMGEIPNSINIIENNTNFTTDLLSGQKTGWYYDQRTNRQMAIKYGQQKTVLDIFSYTGSFGVQLAKHGAEKVICIDSSHIALQTAFANAGLNEVADKVTIMQGDAMEAMNILLQQTGRFDVVCIDPPALIKKRKDIPAGQKAYQKLNELAIRLVKNGGILISSSCSMHMSRELFTDVLQKAANKAERNLQILEQGFQALDHPVNPAMPETEYLKTVFCLVDV